MMRALWLTDIHLNFMEDRQVSEYLASLRKLDCDAVWIGGDIGEADSIEGYLLRMQEILTSPIYFILGNHDYYQGTIKDVRGRIRDLCRQNSDLCWLAETGAIECSSNTAILGHDSWADGRLGDFWNSDLLLNDYILIEEFNPWMAEARKEGSMIDGGMASYMDRLDGPAARTNRLATMQALAQEAAAHLQQNLPEAMDRFQNVYFLTHAPPYQEACLHHANPSSDSGLPHFSSRIVGDTILEIMTDYPDRMLTVLCGHTHSPVVVKPALNVEVHVGRATYGVPDIQKIFKI
jgi:predicted phosphodiesterase